MSSYKVKFLPHNKEIIVSGGQKLIRAAMEAGVHINASCGGEGVCGKCRVLLEEGELGEGVSEKLSKEDIDRGYRLACKSIVNSDVTIRIPLESSIDAKALNLQSTPRQAARIRKMNFDQLKEEGLFIPPVEKIYLELPAPDLQEHLPDVTRLVNFLRLHHDEHRLVVDMKVIRKIPDVFREDDFKVTATLMRPVQKGRRTHIINIHAGDTANRNYAIAVDIGTTTIYGQLIDLHTGDTLAQRGEFNAQVSYGEDVISRIIYAEKAGGLETLQRVVVESINKVINKVIKRAKIDKDYVSTITMAGNTTMSQLLLQVNPKYIRRAPYVPTASIYPPIRASDLGIDLGTHVAALVYPQVSSYVGGDIVAGVMGSGMYRTDKLTLFMDIGTNAEIVIGNREWMACAACSAGPAFEGGHINSGMRASVGAIDKFSIGEDQAYFHVVGETAPKGICGTGLVDVVAELRRVGIIDETGKIVSPESGLSPDWLKKCIEKNQKQSAYILFSEIEPDKHKELKITQQDIREIQLAKGAVGAGISILCKELGISVNEIEKILIAGAFGSYMNKYNAQKIGLIPDISIDKVTYVGNAASLGAKKFLLSKKTRIEARQVVKNTEYIELSSRQDFQDIFAEKMLFV